MTTLTEMLNNLKLPVPKETTENELKSIFSPDHSTEHMYEQYVQLWKQKNNGDSTALWLGLDGESKKETAVSKKALISDIEFLKQQQFYDQISEVSPEFADVLLQKRKKTVALFEEHQFQFDWPLKASNGKTADHIEELTGLLKGLKSLAHPDDQETMSKNILAFIKQNFTGFENNTRDEDILTCLMKHVTRNVAKEQESRKEKNEKSQWEVLLGDDRKTTAFLFTHEGIPAPILPLTQKELITVNRIIHLPSRKIIAFLQKLGIDTDHIPFIQKTLKRIKQTLFFESIHQVDPAVAACLFSAESTGQEPALTKLMRTVKSARKNTGKRIRELAKKLQHNPDPDEIIPFIQENFIFAKDGKNVKLTDTEITQLEQSLNLRVREKILGDLAVLKKDIEDSLLYLQGLNNKEKDSNDAYIKVTQAYLKILRYQRILERAQSIFHTIQANDPARAEPFETRLKPLTLSTSGNSFVEDAIKSLQKQNYLLTLNPGDGLLRTSYHVNANELHTKNGIPLSELCTIFRDSSKSKDQRLEELKKKGVKVESGHPSVLCTDKTGRKVFFKFNKHGVDDVLTSPLEAAISQVYSDDLGVQAPEVHAVYDEQGSVGVLSVGIPGFHDFVELKAIQNLLDNLEEESAPSPLTEGTLIDKLNSILKKESPSNPLIKKLASLLKIEEKKNTASKALDLFSNGQMTIQEFKEIMTAKGQIKRGLAAPTVVSHFNQEDDNHLGNGGIAYLRNEKGEIIDHEGKVIPLDAHGKLTRKPVYVITRIDFDMSFWEVLATAGVQKRTEALGELPTFPLDISNLILFPQVHDGGWYGFSRYHFLLANLPVKSAEKRQKKDDGIGTDAYTALQNDPNFRREKWKVFLRLAIKPPQLFQDALLKHLNGDNAELLSVTNEMSAFAANRRQELENQLVQIPEFWEFMEQDADRTELTQAVEALKKRGVPEGYLEKCKAAYERLKTKCIEEKRLAGTATKRFIRTLPNNNPLLNVLKQKLQAGKAGWVMKKDVTKEAQKNLISALISIPTTADLYDALWGTGIYLTLEEVSAFKQELFLSLIKNEELVQCLRKQKSFLKHRGLRSTQSLIEKDLNPALKEGPIATFAVLQKLGVTIPLKELEKFQTLSKNRSPHTSKALEALDVPYTRPSKPSAWRKTITTSELIDSLDLVFEPQVQMTQLSSQRSSQSNPSSMDLEWSLFEKVDTKNHQRVVLTTNEKVKVELPDSSPQSLGETEEGEVIITPTTPSHNKPRKLVYEYKENQSGMCIPDSKGDIIYRAVLALRKLHYDKTGNELVSLVLDDTILKDGRWDPDKGMNNDIIRQIEMAGINRNNILMPMPLSTFTPSYDKEAATGRGKGG